MLIINADDLGKTKLATDKIIDCYKKELITSATAMVFMKDSARASILAVEAGLETGLHINLTLPLDGSNATTSVKEKHLDIVRYFRFSKWAQVVYNPYLNSKIKYVYKAQYDEYVRLFGKEPLQIDGHHHIHLCMNMVCGRIISLGARVRRNNTFESDEKNRINRLYRRLVDRWLQSRYLCTDAFFSLEAERSISRLETIAALARVGSVELAVHPENSETYAFLGSSLYWELISKVPRGTYSSLKRPKRHSRPF